MSPQQEAVALWKYLESRGFKPTVRLIGRALREQGLTFDDKALRAWLKPFHRGATAPTPHESRTITATAPQPHRGYAREKEVSLFSKPESEVLRTSSSDVAPQQPAKKPRQTKLPYDRDLLERRYAILKAVWSRVQPLIGRTTTWTDWRKRNSVIAASFALGGFTPEQILRAWELTTTADGDPVRELWLVQRKMEQISAAKARHLEAAHA